MRTGIIMDKRYMEHDMGAFHVENPKRLEIIYDMIEKEISFPFLKIEPRLANQDEIEMIHTPSYINSIRETAGKESVILDPDTSTSARSNEVALLAAGGVLNAIDLIMEKRIQNVFALIRPPGHHAESSHAMGFCLFNNIAIGAEYLLKKHRLQRVLIIDWDLHHGNGTQHSFYSRKDVLYFSAHQYPHYPGTGQWGEVGIREGEGYTVNVPLSGGKTDEDYLYIFKNILSPIASAFKPDFILLSAGFDIYTGDPLGGMQVTGEGFGALACQLLELAHSHSEGRFLVALEGGYDLQGLRDGVKYVLLQLSGEAEKPNTDEKASLHTESELIPVFETQKKYWPL